ncbi:OV-16 antigen [Cytospora mali]|uniref:OV-16 antigen n=1 Tax=Cytospora mali TaxID=578113 RepID=A0A194VGG5_CYTMA|nr:OV-16 antigen [Valsa mali var. pyri (nom. inval.)]
MQAAMEAVTSLLDQAKAALQTHGERLSQSLQEAKLLPGTADGLIPTSFKPTTQLHVSYNGKDVDLGNLFRVYECKVAPDLSFQREADVDSNTAYTLMLVDPDAPTPDDPKYAFWRHWVITGLEPLSGEGKVVAATKQPATSYHPPGPTKESKPHRYLFLLFREPIGHGLDIRAEDVGGEEFTQRRSFHPAEFAQKHGLELVGLNWMRCAADDREDV